MAVSVRTMHVLYGCIFVWVRGCVCLNVCVCLLACARVCLGVHVFVCMLTWMFTCVCMRVHLRVNSGMCLRTCAFACVCMCVYLRACLRACLCLLVCACVCLPACVCVCQNSGRQAGCVRGPWSPRGGRAVRRASSYHHTSTMEKMFPQGSLSTRRFKWWRGWEREGERRWRGATGSLRMPPLISISPQNSGMKPGGGWRAGVRDGGMERARTALRDDRSSMRESNGGRKGGGRRSAVVGKLYKWVVWDKEGTERKGGPDDKPVFLQWATRIHAFCYHPNIACILISALFSTKTKTNQGDKREEMEKSFRRNHRDDIPVNRSKYFDVRSLNSSFCRVPT